MAKGFLSLQISRCCLRGQWRSHEDPAERIVGKSDCHPSASVASRRAGLVWSNTCAHCMCCVDAQGRLHLAHSHLFLTQTELAHDDPNSGWSFVLKREPVVGIRASSMKTCLFLTLILHVTSVMSMAIVLAAFWQLGFLMKFSFKKKKQMTTTFSLNLAVWQFSSCGGAFHLACLSVYGKATDPWGRCVGIAGSNLSCQTHSEELIIRNVDSYIFVKCQFDRSTDSWRASNRPVIA